MRHPQAFAWSLLYAVVLSPPALARESGRDTNIHLRLGSYAPSIDDEFDLSAPNTPDKGPYERVFGDDDPLMFMLTYERHLRHDFGTLAAGMGAGYWNVTGRGIPQGGAGEATDTTEMTIYPFLAQLSYHLDLFQDTFPIVPMMRAGLDLYLWDILDGSNETAEFEPGKRAAGTTMGWHVSVGAGLLLDWFDPGMASDFDRDAGVNNSYLVFEYQIAQVDDFGASDSLRLGNNTFLFGLALDL